MAIFGYVRVSTTDQTNKNQRLEIARAGYAVEYWGADTTSGSAHAAQPPQFKKLFDKLRKGDTPGGVEAGPAWARCAGCPGHYQELGYAGR